MHGAPFLLSPFACAPAITPLPLLLLPPPLLPPLPPPLLPLPDKEHVSPCNRERAHALLQSENGTQTLNPDVTAALRGIWRPNCKH
jgi:hypothetical protein